MSKEEKWETLCRTAAEQHNKSLVAEKYRDLREDAQRKLEGIEKKEEQEEMTK